MRVLCIVDRLGRSWKFYAIVHARQMRGDTHA